MFFPPARKFYVFGEPLGKPDSEKTLYERNQESINTLVVDSDVLNDLVDEDSEDDPPLPGFQCKHCGKPYKTLTRMTKHESDCSHGK
ncbi:MAG: hypothetical protein KKF30_07470 [Proteobacteria bacterium]|nr:hypothetical protein [Pseudomonadota bacterium]MBU4470293.1 hypothetical protein [Pseudomonadota bacterium]MCG2752706.1 hypothetical protein [Desulfobacteraceae bacterium]